MERQQAMKVRLRDSLKKIRRFSHSTKRSATIPTSRKDSPLLHKDVEIQTTRWLIGINVYFNQGVT